METPAKLYTLSCFTFESEKLPSQPRRCDINTCRSYLPLRTRKISRRMEKKKLHKYEFILDLNKVCQKFCLGISAVTYNFAEFNEYS